LQFSLEKTAIREHSPSEVQVSGSRKESFFGQNLKGHLQRCEVSELTAGLKNPVRILVRTEETAAKAKIAWLGPLVFQ